MKDIRKLIERITPEMLQNMLNFMGFHKNNFNEGNVHFVQYLSADEVDSVKVPLLRGDVDFEGNIVRLLEYLSARTSTSVESMVLRLLNPAYDVLKWRMSGDEADTGKVSLLRMSENIDNIKAVLSASCLDILTPNQRYHKRNRTKKVSETLDQYKFGQTEYGSFLVNILCPLGNYNYAMFDMQEMPFLRKVNLHVLDAYFDIQTAIAENNSNKVDEDVDAGIYSVNLLDAMSDVYRFTLGRNLSFNIEWSDRVPFEDERKDRNIVVDTNCINTVLEIADKYRPKEDKEMNKSFVGKVEYLGSEAEVDRRMTIAVKAAVFGNDNKPIKISAELDYAQYAQIVQDAFESGLNVRLTGDYCKSGNKHVLRNAEIAIID